MQWQVKTFKQLKVDELYQLLKLRIDVFVVEQTCYYPDLDDLDTNPETLHVFAMERGRCAAYLRVLAPGTSYPTMPSLGRVATADSHRGDGLGHELVKLGLKQIEQIWPDLICHISAQTHLQGFYQQHGFTAVGEGYLEDGIPHIGMERPASK